MAGDHTRTQREYRERILRVLVHIQQNLDDELSLDDLATIACFSPFHFHRIFTGMVGESVRQHIRRLRLERAAMRLRHTDRAVTMIAFEAGYESHEAFTRAFGRAFACSPTVFRESAAHRHRLASQSGVHFHAADASLSFTPIHGATPRMNVEIKTIEPFRAAFFRHVGPYEQVGPTWERLTDFVGRECLFGPTTRLFGAAWDDPEMTPPEKIRYDACVTVDSDFEAQGEVGVQTLGGGRYAVVLHEGPYENLADTYNWLMGQWFPSQDVEPGDPPSMEFYLNDPGSTAPEDLLTEICIRLAE